MRTLAVKRGPASLPLLAIILILASACEEHGGGPLPPSSAQTDAASKLRDSDAATRSSTAPLAPRKAAPPVSSEAKTPEEVLEKLKGAWSSGCRGGPQTEGTLPRSEKDILVIDGDHVNFYTFYYENSLSCSTQMSLPDHYTFEIELSSLRESDTARNQALATDLIDEKGAGSQPASTLLVKAKLVTDEGKAGDVIFEYFQAKQAGFRLNINDWLKILPARMAKENQIEIKDKLESYAQAHDLIDRTIPYTALVLLTRSSNAEITAVTKRPRPGQ